MNDLHIYFNKDNVWSTLQIWSYPVNGHPVKLRRPASQTHLCVHTTSLHQTQNYSEGSLLTSKVLSETISVALFPCLTQPYMCYWNGYCVLDDSSACPLENPAQATVAAKRKYPTQSWAWRISPSLMMADLTAGWWIFQFLTGTWQVFLSWHLTCISVGDEILN